MTIHNQSIDGKVLLQENDPVNLQLFEAFISESGSQNFKNSREKCIELGDL